MHLIQQTGCTRATAKTGAVTLIQRFGSALNLNIHFHMLFLDGVYLADRETPVFRRLPAPCPQALEGFFFLISMFKENDSPPGDRYVEPRLPQLA